MCRVTLLDHKQYKWAVVIRARLSKYQHLTATSIKESVSLKVNNGKTNSAPYLQSFVQLKTFGWLN